jgi:hypothetical protein
MTEQEAKPWFGKKCANCDAPINYAYKGHVLGWCGKCTDQLRNLFKDDLRHDIERELASKGGAGRGGGGAGKLFAGLVLGLVLGFGGAVATAVYAPETWRKVEDVLVPAKSK